MSNLLFKSQLQEYAQKACLSAPVYETVKEGPPHIPNFKASVILNGKRYDSPDCFRNRKTAEHAAAQIALQELRQGGVGGGHTTNPVVTLTKRNEELTSQLMISALPSRATFSIVGYETGLCKNLLQEYAQKLSLPVPSYKCTKEGDGHAALFTSTVEIAGICYQGGTAKSKKGAEIKAARTALTAIQAQQGFQGFHTNPTTTHPDDPVAHAGMKRERAPEQPSKKRRGKKNKRHKALRKRKEVIQGSTEKEEKLGESSSKATENGQETASVQNATTVNIDDQHKHLKQEGHSFKETGQTMEIQEQLGAEVVAVLVVAESNNQGGNMADDPRGNGEQYMKEKNEETDKLSVEKGQKEPETTEHEHAKQEKIEETDKLAVEKEGQKEQETTQHEQVMQEKIEETDKISVDKDGQEQDSTQHMVVDPLVSHEEYRKEPNKEMEEEPLEQEDGEEHET